MPNAQSWQLSFANGEGTRVENVARVTDDGNTLTFENAEGETVCLANRGALLMAKRIDA